MPEAVSLIEVPVKTGTRRNESLDNLVRKVAELFEARHSAVRVTAAELAETGVKWAANHAARKLRALGYDVRLRRGSDGSAYFRKK